MSARTLDALEDAIRDHFLDTMDEDATDDRKSAVLIDWVVGYTISNIVEVEGKNVVGFSNDYIAADSNPNGQVTLAHWTGEQISYALDPNNADD